MPEPGEPRDSTRSAGHATTLADILPNGRSIDLIAEGKMANLAVGGSRGNSIEIMDLGFSLPAPSAEIDDAARAMVAKRMR